MDSRQSVAFGFAIDKTYLTNEQYAGMTNYQHRKNISLIEWHALQYVGAYDLNNVDNILEVGCGDGTFWNVKRDNKYAFHPRHVTITDLSKKMLDECQHNLSDRKLNVDYQIADVDALPFGKGTFNAVLAHKVIYHAIDPSKAILGIREVLKPDGIFGMSVLTNGVNRSVWELAHSLDPQIPDRSFTSRFCDIEADKILPTIFEQVERRDYVNTLELNNSEQVVNAVKSSPVVLPLKLSDNFFALFKKKIEDKIAEEGCFKSENNASLYLCRKIQRQ